jgi:hypothetical protein
MRQCNGATIPTGLETIKVEKLFPKANSRTEEVEDLREPCKMVSDSSNFKAAIISIDEEFIPKNLEFVFSERERMLSSGHRELLAIKKTVSHWEHLKLMERKRIFWITDSTNVVAFLEKGSSKSHIQKDIFDLMKSLSVLKSRIVPIHFFREDERIKMADELSKMADSDDWSIDEVTFQDLKKEFDLKTDIFASETNARLRRFFSKFYSADCSGVDAFAQIWSRGCFMAPPVSLLSQTADEIAKRKNCEGIIIMPNWPTSMFFGKFFEEELVPKWPFKFEKQIFPYIYQNQNAKTALLGRVRQGFYVLSFIKYDL